MRGYKAFDKDLKCRGADWSNVTEEDFEFIKSLPNFDADIFEACTGVKIK